MTEARIFPVRLSGPPALGPAKLALVPGFSAQHAEAAAAAALPYASCCWVPVWSQVNGYPDWREAARDALLHDIPPESILLALP